MTAALLLEGILSAGSINGMRTVLAAEDEILTDGSVEPEETTEQQNTELPAPTAQEDEGAPPAASEDEASDDAQPGEDTAEKESDVPEEAPEVVPFAWKEELSVQDDGVYAELTLEGAPVASEDGSAFPAQVRVSLYRRAEDAAALAEEAEEAEAADRTAALLQEAARCREEEALDEQSIRFDEAGNARCEIPARELAGGAYLLIAAAEDEEAASVSESAGAGLIALKTFEVVHVEAEQEIEDAPAVTVSDGVILVSAEKKAEDLDEADAAAGAGTETAENAETVGGETDAEGAEAADGEADAEGAGAEAEDADYLSEGAEPEEGESLITEEALSGGISVDSLAIIGSDMYKGQVQQLSLVFNRGENPQPEDKRVIWESSDKSVLTVDANGQVKALAEGKSAIITATSVEIPSIRATKEIFVYGKMQMTLKAVGKLPLKKTEGATLLLTVPASSGTDVEDFTVFHSDSKILDILDLPEYDREASNDKNDVYKLVIKPADVKLPGTVTVTARHTRGQSASCTLTFDGAADVFRDDMVVIHGGKRLTGWVYLKQDPEDVSGWLVTTAKDADYTFYIDPATGKRVTNITRIGNQLYMFDSSGRLFNNVSDMQEYDPEGAGKVWLGKGGKLLTGWQPAKPAAGQTQCYYDPQTGLWATNTFVPYKNGMAYVKDDGSRLENGWDSSQERYYQNGVMKTGWLYLDAANNLVKKAQATRWLYADPETGLVIKTAPVSRKIGIKGKSYCFDGFERGFAHGNGGYALAETEDYDKMPGKYEYVVDANGVIQFNKTVTVKIGDMQIPTKVRLDAKGYPFCGIVFEGKKAVYYEHGLAKEAGTSQLAKYDYQFGFKYEFYYRTNEANAPSTDADKVYIAAEKSGELVFYTDESMTQKLDNEWVRDYKAHSFSTSSREQANYYYVQKGKIVKGFRTIGNSCYCFSPTDGRLVYDGSRGREYDLFRLSDGKLYLQDNDLTDGTPFPGRIVTGEAGLKVTRCTSFFYFTNQLVYINANGVAATGWKTVDGKKYFFNSSGYAVKGKAEIINGKLYEFDENGVLQTRDNATVVYSGSEPQYVLQKDGTRKNGWIYLDAEKKLVSSAAKAEKIYYAVDGWVIYALGTTEMLCIDGKYYFFDTDGTSIRRGGWYRHDWFINVRHVNSGTNGNWYSESPYIFYLDPVTGAVKTGAQTLPAPQVSGSWPEETIQLDGTGKIVVSSVKKKLYFNEAEGEYPAGALMSNRTVYIGGKPYQTGADGSVHTGASDTLIYDGTRVKGHIGKNGKLSRGRTKVGNWFYYFDPETGYPEINCLRKTGSKWYYYGEYGTQETPAGTTPFQAVGSDVLVYAQYASDGSVKGILYEGTNVPAASRVIQCKGGIDKVVLNAKGVPVAGIASGYEGSELKNYCHDTDGDTFGHGPQNGLVRFGGRYYVVAPDGVLLCNAQVPVGWMGGSGIPDADRKAFDAYSDYLLGDEFDPIACTDAKGAVQAKKAVTLHESLAGLPGITVAHTGRLGIALDAFPFYKFGGKWYVSKRVTGDVDTMMPGEVSILSYWCRYGRGAVVQSVGARGTSENPFLIDIGYGYHIHVKNGKPQSGNQTVKLIGGNSQKYYCDPDSGLLLW